MARTVTGRTARSNHWVAWIVCVAASCDADPADPCASLPSGSLSVRQIEVAATEDLDFDRHGNVVGSDWHTLVWSRRDGEVMARVPGIDTPAGLRLLPDDDLLVASVTTGEVIRLSPDGGRVPVLSGLNWPNGIACLPDGSCVATELSGDRVWQFDPDGGDGVVIAEIVRPNGVVVDRDGALLIGTMDGSGRLYRLEVGSAATVEATGLGTGYLDGVGVDACGNRYVSDYEGRALLRVGLDGAVETLVSPVPDGGFWAGLRWGSGVDGWHEDRLYLSDPASGTVWEVDIGVASGSLGPEDDPSPSVRRGG